MSANVNVYLEDFVSNPLSVKQVVFKPTGSNVSVSGEFIVLADEISKYTNGVGYIALTNMVAGYYNVVVSGKSKKTEFGILVPDDSNTYNAKDLITPFTASLFNGGVVQLTASYAVSASYAPSSGGGNSHSASYLSGSTAIVSNLNVGYGEPPNSNTLFNISASDNSFFQIRTIPDNYSTIFARLKDVTNGYGGDITFNVSPEEGFYVNQGNASISIGSTGEASFSSQYLNLSAFNDNSQILMGAGAAYFISPLGFIFAGGPIDTSNISISSSNNNSGEEDQADLKLKCSNFGADYTGKISFENVGAGTGENAYIKVDTYGAMEISASSVAFLNPFTASYAQETPKVITGNIKIENNNLYMWDITYATWSLVQLDAGALTFTNI